MPPGHQHPAIIRQLSLSTKILTPWKQYQVVVYQGRTHLTPIPTLHVPVYLLPLYMPLRK